MNVIFTQEVKRRASNARLDWHTATTLHPSIVNTDLWPVRCWGGKVGEDERWPGFGVAGLGRDAAVCKDAGEGGVDAGIPGCHEQQCRKRCVLQGDEEKGGFTVVHQGWHNGRDIMRCEQGALLCLVWFDSCGNGQCCGRCRNFCQGGFWCKFGRRQSLRRKLLMCALLFAKDIVTTCYRLSIYMVLTNHIMKSNKKSNASQFFSSFAIIITSGWQGFSASLAFVLTFFLPFPDQATFLPLFECFFDQLPCSCHVVRASLRRHSHHTRARLPLQSVWFAIVGSSPCVQQRRWQQRWRWWWQRQWQLQLQWRQRQRQWWQ